jgi:hypothetical protein
MTVPPSVTFVTKRHARRPYFRLYVTDANGNPFDFSGAVSARFIMNNEDGVEKVNSLAVIESPSTLGYLRYEWKVGDTDTEGEFTAEFDVDYGAGEHMTLPLDGVIIVRIYADLDDA